MSYSSTYNFNPPFRAKICATKKKASRSKSFLDAQANGELLNTCAYICYEKVNRVGG